MAPKRRTGELEEANEAAAHRSGIDRRRMK